MGGGVKGSFLTCKNIHVLRDAVPSGRILAAGVHGVAGGGHDAQLGDLQQHVSASHSGMNNTQ